MGGGLVRIITSSENLESNLEVGLLFNYLMVSSLI